MRRTSSPEMIAFWDELEKISYAESPGIVRSFVGGVDPFGLYTSGVGQAAERTGASPGRIAALNAAGIAGGALGGAVVVPAAVGAATGALHGGLSAPGGAKAKLLAAGAGALSGALKPYKTLHSSRIASKALRRASKGTGSKLSDVEMKALIDTLSSAPVKALASVQKAPSSYGELAARLGVAEAGLAKNVSNAQAAARKLQAIDDELSAGFVRKELAELAEPALTAAYRTGATGLALGGGIGATSAAVQFGKGRRAEREFQERMNAQKTAASRAEQDRKTRRMLEALGGSAIGLTAGYLGANKLLPAILNRANIPKTPSPKATALLTALSGLTGAALVSAMGAYKDERPPRATRKLRTPGAVQSSNGQLAKRHQGHSDQVLARPVLSDATRSGVLPFRAGTRPGEYRRGGHGADHHGRGESEYRFRGKTPRDYNYARPLRVRKHEP